LSRRRAFGASKRCFCNRKVIDEILADNQGQVEQYKSGKQQVFGFFVGQTMKAMKESESENCQRALSKEARNLKCI